MTRPSRTHLILSAAAGSALLLLGAFGFQHLAGLAPCELCLWQRWPHAVAVAIGALALLLGGRVLPFLGMAAALAAAGLGLYHTGVERAWWAGPAACSGTGQGLTGMSGADLLSTAVATPIVMCDEVAWQFLGLSMASWNMAFSLGLALLWLAAVLRGPKAT